MIHRSDSRSSDQVPLLETKDLSVHFPGRTSRQPVWQVLRRVSLTIDRGTALGLVGESGSGKTTLGQAILRRVDPVSGSILFDGADITTSKGSDLRRLRSRMQMVFQNPVGSLNPRMTILENVAEPLLAHGRHKNARAAENDVAVLMDRVGLRPSMMSHYPHQFSGGQCQRVGIARALAINPDFIVADEPVSSLDVSIQAQIVNLLADLRRERGLTMLFIAHDLAVVRHIADRVATMYAGEIVEVADSRPLYERPRHPYTDELLAAIPLPVYPRRRSTSTRHNAGAAPELTTPPEGCVFASRCRFVRDRCRTEKPLLRSIAPGRLVACHFAEDLELLGSTPRDHG